MSMIAPLAHLSGGQIAARPVALVRIAIGLAALGAAMEAWLIMPLVLRPTTLAFPYIEGFLRLPAPAIPLFIALWMSAALCFTIGWQTRLAGGIVLACMGYTLICDQQFYSNHLYLLTLVLLLLTLARSGACLALDARRHAATHIPAWPLTLLKWQVAIVYAFSALTKINPVYLSGAVLAAHMHPQLVAALHALLPFLAALSIAVELFLAVGLWLPRLRWQALMLGLGLHCTIIATLGWSQALSALQLTLFAITIMAPYLLFFTPIEHTTSPTASLALEGDLSG